MHPTVDVLQVITHLPPPKVASAPLGSQTVIFQFQTLMTSLPIIFNTSDQILLPFSPNLGPGTETFPQAY
jgi:hypothetical protein